MRGLNELDNFLNEGKVKEEKPALSIETIQQNVMEMTEKFADLMASIDVLIANQNSEPAPADENTAPAEPAPAEPEENGLSEL